MLAKTTFSQKNKFVTDKVGESSLFMFPHVSLNTETLLSTDIDMSTFLYYCSDILYCSNNKIQRSEICEVTSTAPA